MNKRKVGALVISMAIATSLLSGCAMMDYYKEEASKKETEEIVQVQPTEVPRREEETKVFEIGRHIFSQRFFTRRVQNQELSGNQINIPEGYEVLEIENFNGGTSYGYSVTSGYDVWFINTQVVEATEVYNETINDYEYSAPGRVITPTVEQEGPTLKLTP